MKVTWMPLNLASILPADEIETGLEGLNAVISALNTASAVATAMMSTVSLTTLVEVDAARELLDSALELLDAAVGSLADTGIYVLTLPPANGRRVQLSASQSLRKLYESRFDINDPRRPIATTSGTYFGTMGIFVAYGSSEGAELWAKLTRLLGLMANPGPLRPVSSRYIGVPRVSPGTGELPDWESLKLGDLGVVGDILQVVGRIRFGLANSISTVDNIRGMIDALTRRAAAQALLLQRALALIREFAELTEGTSAASLLVIEGEGNTIEQANAAILARYHEDYPFTGLETESPVAALFIHVQSESPGVVATALRIFGTGGEADSAREDFGATDDELVRRYESALAEQRAAIRRIS